MRPLAAALAAAATATASSFLAGTCAAFGGAPLPSLAAGRGGGALGSAAATAATSATAASNPLADFDYLKEDTLPWMEDGYQTWEHAGNKINYLEMGDPSNPALLLIHGFGASAYHWRRNVPNLARDHHVFAIDMLGFGLSDKPVQDYTAEVWRDQALAFVEEVIGKRTAVAGNSLGGFTALYAAADSAAQAREEGGGEDLIAGCVLLNGAGRFRDPDAAPEPREEDKNAVLEGIKTALQRLVIAGSFYYTKRPARIEQVLRQVYPVNPSMVDDDLVESIRVPSLDPNAAEVFYRVIVKNGSGPQVCIDDLLERMDGKPLMLAWGESDPWIRSEAADRIQGLYPTSVRRSIDAGHCPHDEAPEAVNAAIREFTQGLEWA